METVKGWLAVGAAIGAGIFGVALSVLWVLCQIAIPIVIVGVAIKYIFY